MIETPHVDWFALTPALILLGAAGVLLLGAVLVPARVRRPFSAIVAAVAFVGAFVAAVWLYVESADPTLELRSAFFRDRYGALAQVVLCGTGLLAVGVSYAHRMRDEHVGEYYALLTAAVAGMALFVTAGNLMTLFLALEWFSICLYVLCAIDIDFQGSL